MIRNTKILVVDDDPNTLESTSRALKATGYRVIRAATGEECIEKARKEHPDLILLDVVLPDIDGVEVCSQIKADPAMDGTFVVLLSGIKISPKHQAAGLDMGADGYIARPVTSDELLARVHSMVRIRGAEESLKESHKKLEQRVTERTVALTKANEQLQKEIAKREHSEKFLEERLRFEQILSELSAMFINISADKMGAGIDNALNEIRNFFRFDRCGLLGLSPDRTTVRLTHAAYDEGIEHVSGDINLKTLFPWIYKRLLEGKHVAVTRLEDQPAEADLDKKSHEAMGVLSFLAIPLFSSGKLSHIFAINAMREHRTWPDELIPRLRVLGEIFVNALERSQMEEQLKVRLREIENLRQQFEKENIYLRKEAQVFSDESRIIGESGVLKKVLAQARQVAQSESTVLILGETGTGKELIAQAIHNLSKRQSRIMVKVNCASLPAALIESELFGREKGAYTGALTKQIGRFELADSSTILLDEIAELPLELQAKLLRVLQDGEFERLGSPKTIRVDVRVIAATNQNLEEAISKGTFREDLYYRLKVFPIEVPPLRQREGDIPLLIHAFLNEFSGKMGKRIRTLDESTMDKLKQYHWPGNVRELRNIIEQGVIITDGDTLQVNLPRSLPGTNADTFSLEEAERRHIIAVLEKTRWRIKGRGGAAEMLGLKPSTLYTKMEKLGIQTGRGKGAIPTLRRNSDP